MAPPPTELELAATGTAAAVVRFAGALRRGGLRADLDAVIGFTRALSALDTLSEEDVRAAGSAFFVNRPEERTRYDAVFDAFWLDRHRDDLGPDTHSAGGGAAQPEHETPARDGSGSDAAPVTGSGADDEPDRAEPEPDEGVAPDADAAAAALAYSAAEALRTRSFDAMTAEERLDAARLVDDMRPRIARRRTRRYRLRHDGTLLAPRAMMRRSLATAGDPLAWLWRRRRTRPRPIVAICDISGSMEQHSRFALRFVHALARLDVRTEAFVFGTRLTRITPHLRHRDADRALGEVAASVRDWAGGTQIGTALHVFNRQWARRVLRSSAIVIIVSDGWDRGDPRTVEREMALLRRRCHRIVWLNPLAATAGYQPRTAGMVAALPHIDDFRAIGSIASLAELGQLLAGEVDDGRSRAVSPILA
jgi:uncharacterized protein with von Willebrand factor type A (vWA) domain